MPVTRNSFASISQKKIKVDTTNQTMIDANEALMALAFERYCAGARFLQAGMNEDCIQTTLDGLGALEVTLVNDFVSIQTATDNEALQDPTSIVNRHPISLSFKEMQTRSDLLIAMLYNLALAYHLHALTLNNQEDSYTTLEDAFRLYQEVERRLRIRKSICFDHDAIYHLSSSLQNNMKNLVHVGLLLAQRQSSHKLQADPILSINSFSE